MSVAVSKCIHIPHLQLCRFKREYTFNVQSILQTLFCKRASSQTNPGVMGQSLKTYQVSTMSHYLTRLLGNSNLMCI